MSAGRQIVIAAALSAALALASTPSLAAKSGPLPAPALSQQIVGWAIDYTIRPGDIFIKLGAAYGIGAAVLAAENGMTVGSRLTAGNTLHIDNRHIVPQQLADGILINLPQRLVFQFEGGRLIGAYPAAVGRVAPQWRTATGTFRVIQIREDPVWRVPDDVREEAHLNGRVIKARIEPGPDNPLGDYWLGLSLPELGIHGTNSPLSIYGFRTHGCIRLSPDDIEELYDGVDLGDGGEIIYEPVMFAKLDDGRVFLEVNRDAYKRGMSGMDFVHGLATNLGVVSMIDWKRAQQVVAAEEGIARDVTLAPGSEMKKVRGALRELLR